MKKLLLLFLLLTPIVLNSQWRYKSETDAFDGNKISAWAKGSGGKFPYESPTLTFRRQDGNLDVYINKVGYTGCDGLTVAFSFGNPDDVISFKGSPSTDNEAVFLSYTWDSNSSFDLVNLIEKLKRNSLVYVRVRSQCGINRFTIGLQGSTIALNKVTGKALDGIIEEFYEYYGGQGNVADIIANNKENIRVFLSNLPEFEYPIIIDDFIKDEISLKRKINNIDSITYKPRINKCLGDVLVWRNGGYKVNKTLKRLRLKECN